MGMCSDYAEPEKVKDAHEPSASSKGERYSPTAMRAVQGKEKDAQPDPETQLPKLEIKASEFSDQTRQALKDQGLDDPKVVLADNSGGRAEQTTQTVLKNEGLPDGSGGTVKFKDVVPGQYDDSNHGIDLVGVTEDGRPYIIEVKKRQNSSQDDLGEGKVQDLTDQSKVLRKDILRERQLNPAMRARHPSKHEASQDTGREKTDQRQSQPDSELSMRQMGGMWTRDRWLRLVEDPASRQNLLDAGVDEKYLNLDNLKNAYSKEWEEILDNRTTVIVSGEKDRASNRLTQQATLQRGTDVFILDLEQ